MQVSRWIEPQDDSTCMVLLCHPRRVFCRIGRGVGEGVQSESRSTGDDRAEALARRPSRGPRPRVWAMLDEVRGTM